MIRRRITVFSLTMLAIGWVTLLPFRGAPGAPQRRDRQPLRRCTPEALSALKPIPQLEYECAERQDDNLKGPERRAAMKDYLREIESVFAEPIWWATPVEALNLCAAIHEARPMTDQERDDFLDDVYEIALYGDQSTRLVVVSDPCIQYSYRTLNAFILQRDGGRVVATQVVNAYYTRIDNPIQMTLAQHNGERLVMVETHTSDGLMPPSLYTTYYVYTISPSSHRAVPKKIFKDRRKLTHEFRCDNYLFGGDGLAAKLAERWRAPEIIRNGRLSPRFIVYTPVRHRLARDTYIWNGKHYARRR